MGSMDSNGFQRIAMEIHGSPWISMDHGNRWIPMGFHGFASVSVGSRGFLQVPENFGLAPLTHAANLLLASLGGTLNENN